MHRRTLLPLPLLSAACTPDEPKPDDDPRMEGTELGDCTDGADNDNDGLFDCDDDGCAGAPDCSIPALRPTTTPTTTATSTRLRWR